MTTTTQTSEKAVKASAIENEARNAARTHDDVNACCPYPFRTNAGQVYRAAFKEERDWLTRGATGSAQAGA